MGGKQEADEGSSFPVDDRRRGEFQFWSQDFRSWEVASAGKWFTKIHNLEKTAEGRKSEYL